MVSGDPDLRMPPPESHLELSESEKNLVRRWIEQGAEYRNHWAFNPIRPITPPKVESVSWVRNPIDRFVLARLEKEGLAPRPEAAQIGRAHV